MITLISANPFVQVCFSKQKIASHTQHVANVTEEILKKCEFFRTIKCWIKM